MGERKREQRWRRERRKGRGKTGRAGKAAWLLWLLSVNAMHVHMLPLHPHRTAGVDVCAGVHRAPSAWEQLVTGHLLMFCYYTQS